MTAVMNMLAAETVRIAPTDQVCPRCGDFLMVRVVSAVVTADVPLGIVDEDVCTAPRALCDHRAFR